MTYARLTPGLRYSTLVHTSEILTFHILRDFAYAGAYATVRQSLREQLCFFVFVVLLTQELTP